MMSQGNVFITGGSRGIGAEMVRRFTEAGYTVAFTYSKAQKEAEELSRQTGALAIHADSAKRDDVACAVSAFHEKIGLADILINNAAVSSIGLFTDMSDDEWDALRAVNLDSVLQYTRLFIPDMVGKKRGRILQISSMWGQVGASCEVAYSTTKAALHGFTKALAKELGPSGITVNAIAPGVIATQMNASLSESVLAELCEETPLGSLGTPLDVARAALFLAGEGGNFITGQVLGVNGGIVM